MKKEAFIQNTIVIAAPAIEVWDMLTNPNKTKLYMYGCRAVSDWIKGSPLEWIAEIKGKERVFVKGHILHYQPYTQLTFTIFDPNAKIADIPENYLFVTYTLSESHGSTVLQVTQGDFSKVEDGQRRFKEASNNGKGWEPILLRIKEIVENPLNNMFSG